ncbi:carboxymuconolactone decarboxylase family protein [Actinoplanes sp. NPDC024001]|uniref:carboxymuconolactone decarboxylase family protein n=1 Tax=Actinoplanes sp. NPDC024001 TaxID=3154598 RepID=UPI00340C0F1A
MRIPPLGAPYPEGVEDQLAAMMPPGVPPIGLFRTFARNLPMTVAMTGWGSYELSRHLSLSMREREIVILRTCARCACEYEWGVHVMFFADRVGLTGDQLTSLTHGSAGDPCWTDARERVLITVADALHDTSDLDDDLWKTARDLLGEAELLDLFLLCGWYHAISFAARAARVDLEPGAPRFADARP